MKSLSAVFQSRRQHELGGFVVYILEDGPADGRTPVRCVAYDAEHDTLRCGFLAVDGDAREYSLTVILDVFGTLRETEFDESGTVGGLRCVIERFERKFVKVTGVPDPAVFRADREKAIHSGRLP